MVHKSGNGATVACFDIQAISTLGSRREGYSVLTGLLGVVSVVEVGQDTGVLVDNSSRRNLVLRVDAKTNALVSVLKNESFQLARSVTAATTKLAVVSTAVHASERVVARIWLALILAAAPIDRPNIRNGDALGVFSVFDTMSRGH